MSETDPPIGKSDLSSDAVLEMLGTTTQSVSTCALLTPAIKVKLRELGPGQVLEVRVDDLTAREDIVSWCHLAGHELLAVSEDTPQQLRCYIRKKTY